MGQLILRRVLSAPLLLLAVVSLTFVIGRLAPGDPISALVENATDPAVVERVKQQYGLDRAWPEQFWRYLSRLLQGDLGYSYSQGGLPVAEIIGDGWLVSLQLGLLGITLMTLAGLSLGLLAAFQRGGLVDWLVRFLAVLSISVPSFVLAYLALWTFGVQWRWLPLGGWGTWRQAILPTLFLGLPGSAYLARQTRAAVLDVLAQDYIRTARSKGLPVRWVVLRHTLRNALLPVITLLGPALGGIVGGFFFIENIFSIPGIGRLTVQAIFSRDYPLLQALVLLMATSFILANLLVDVIYLWVDPRVRLTGKRQPL